MLVNSGTVMKSVLELFPDFQHRWNNHLQYWEGEELSLGLNLDPLVGFTKDLIYAKRTQDIARLMDFIENLMVRGDAEVKNAIAVSYLESLVNIASWHPELFEGFVPYLGDESKKFCRAWDKFTGAKTPGL